MTSERVDRAAAAVLLALVAALVITVTSGSGSSTVSGRIGGDYPAFYGAGQIVLDGDGDDLYDPERQRTAQRDLFGDDDDGGFLYFAYPPAVAAAYAPLAALPYRVSYVVHTLLMAGALVLALWLIRPMVPVVARRMWVSVAVALAFFPMWRAIGGGQNTALSVLLLAAAWRAAEERRDVACGIALGLLLFKPQLAVLFLGLFLLARRWKVIAAAAGVAALWWVAAVPVAGAGWVGPWLERARWFSALDARVNEDNAVSLIGATHAALGHHAWVDALGVVLALAVVGVVVLAWRRGLPGGNGSMVGPMGVACAGAVLAIPHVMFYDAGLLVLTGAAVLATRDRRTTEVLVVLGAAGLAHLVAGSLPANPLALVGLAMLLLALATIERPPSPRTAFAPWPDAAGPRLSIVIPAYQEAQRIEPTIAAVAAYVARWPAGTVEVVVVDDGSTDGTAETVTVAAAGHGGLDGLRVVRHVENRGKGCAVRTGMLAATGRHRLFMDADGSTPVDDVDRLLAATASPEHPAGADVVIGSIAVDGAEIAVRQSPVRTLLGMMSSVFIGITVLPGIRDSQRGFKLFSGAAADDIFSRCEADGWGFDVEALAVASALGYQVAEVGVRWEHHEGGVLRPRAYMDTLVEVLRIWRRLRRGVPVPRADPAAPVVPV